MEIQKNDLQLTKEAYFKHFLVIHESGLSLKKAFARLEEMCTKAGYKSYYNSFESFKTAFYTRDLEKFS